MSSFCVVCKTERLTHLHSRPSKNDRNRKTFVKYLYPSFNYLTLSFCAQCLEIVDQLTQLDDYLDAVNREISQVIARISKTIILSESENCVKNPNPDNELHSYSQSVVKIKEEQVDLDFLMVDENYGGQPDNCESNNHEVMKFRRELIRRFNPSIVLTNCHPNKTRRKKEDFFMDYPAFSPGDNSSFSGHNIIVDNFSDDDFDASELTLNKKKRVKNKSTVKPKLLDKGEKKKRRSRSSKLTKGSNNPDSKDDDSKGSAKDSTLKIIDRPVQISDNLFSIGGQWHFERTETGYTCCLCGCRGNTMTLITRHINTRHNTNWNKCPVCKKSWRDPKKYEEHVCRPKVLKHKEIVKVGIGKYLYDGRLPFERLSEEERNQNGGFDYKCGTCNELCRTRKGINFHLRVRHGDYTKSMCDLCGKSFTNRRSFEDHKSLHTNVRSFLCPDCGKTFRTFKLLTHHLESHKDPSIRYTCEVCGQTFRYKKGLRRHKLRVGHLIEPAKPLPLSQQPPDITQSNESPLFSLPSSSSIFIPPSSMMLQQVQHNHLLSLVQEVSLHPEI